MIEFLAIQVRMGKITADNVPLHWRPQVELLLLEEPG